MKKITVVPVGLRAPLFVSRVVGLGRTAYMAKAEGARHDWNAITIGILGLGNDRLDADTAYEAMSRDAYTVRAVKLALVGAGVTRAPFKVDDVRDQSTLFALRRLLRTANFKR